MSENFEERWQKGQIQGWKKDKQSVVKFFDKYNAHISSLYDEISKQEYDKMQTICYLISKVRKSIKICAFLDRLAKQGDDVDAIKIFFLIAHAEITMNSFGAEGSKRSLVAKFFEPVKVKYNLDFKIKVIPEKFPTSETIACGADVFYKIRNDYAHEGNYTGSIFRDNDSKPYSYNMLAFRQNGKIITAECNFTYDNFLTMYMEALKENINLYINRK